MYQCQVFSSACDPIRGDAEVSVITGCKTLYLCRKLNSSACTTGLTSEKFEFCVEPFKTVTFQVTPFSVIFLSCFFVFVFFKQLCVAFSMLIAGIQ